MAADVIGLWSCALTAEIEILLL